MKLFKTKKPNIYAELSSGVKKRIIKKAVRQANEEQAKVVRDYGSVHTKDYQATR